MRNYVFALAGTCLAFAVPAQAQDSGVASDGSSEAVVMSAEAAGTLSAAGVELAHAGSAAIGDTAMIFFGETLADSAEALDVWAGYSDGQLPVDERVIVPAPAPAVPFDEETQTQTGYESDQ